MWKKQHCSRFFSAIFFRTTGPKLGCFLFPGIIRNRCSDIILWFTLMCYNVIQSLYWYKTHDLRKWPLCGKDILCLWSCDEPRKTTFFSKQAFCMKIKFFVHDWALFAWITYKSHFSKKKIRRKFQWVLNPTVKATEVSTLAEDLETYLQKI